MCREVTQFVRIYGARDVPLTWSIEMASQDGGIEGGDDVQNCSGLQLNGKGKDFSANFGFSFKFKNSTNSDRLNFQNLIIEN